MIFLTLLQIVLILGFEEAAKLHAEIATLEAKARDMEWDGFLGNMVHQFYTSKTLVSPGPNLTNWKAFERANMKRIRRNQITGSVRIDSLALSKQRVRWRLGKNRGFGEREVKLNAWISGEPQELSFQLEVSFRHVTELQLRSALSSTRKLLTIFGDKDFKPVLKDGIIDSCVVKLSFHPREPEPRRLFLAIYDRNSSLNEIYFSGAVKADRKNNYQATAFGRH